MKNIAVSLVLVCIISFSFAQTNGRLEVAASYGVISESKIFILPETSYGLSNSYKSNGSAFLSFRYFVSKRWALGVSGGIQSYSDQSYAKDKINFSTSTFSAEALYQHSFDEDSNDPAFFHTYSFIGAGATHYNNPLRQGYRPDFQFTPFGIRFGYAFAGFVELGLGYKGIFNGGLCYRIGSRHKFSTQKNEE